MAVNSVNSVTGSQTERDVDPRLEHAIAKGEKLELTFSLPDTGARFAPAALRDLATLSQHGLTQNDCLTLLEAAIGRGVRGAAITLQRSDPSQAYVFDGVDSNVQPGSVVPLSSDARPALLAGLGPTFSVKGPALDGLEKTHWYTAVIDTLIEVFSRILIFGWFSNPKTHTYDGKVDEARFTNVGDALAAMGGANFRKLVQGPPATPPVTVNSRLQDLLRQREPDASKADIKKAATLITERLFAIYNDPSVTDAKLNCWQRLADSVATDALAGFVTGNDVHGFATLRRAVDSTPLSERQLDLVIAGYNHSASRVALGARLGDVLKSAAFTNGAPADQEALLVNCVSLSPAGDVAALGTYFSELQAAHAEDPSFASTVAERLRALNFFSPYTGSIYWEPADLDTLEEFARNVGGRRDREWPLQAAAFARLRDVLPAGATQSFFIKEFAAHHELDALERLYQQKLQVYYNESHATSLGEYRDLQSAGVVPDPALLQELRRQGTGGKKMTVTDVDRMLEHAGADGWFESEQMALLDATLAVGDDNRPVMFADRAAFKRAFNAAILAAINEAMWKAMQEVAPNGISTLELEQLVQKFAWAKGRDGTFKASERKALQEGIKRGQFTSESRAIAQQLVDGKKPADLGLLNTNLDFPERVRVLENYVATAELSPTQQGHAWRLLRDTPEAERVRLVQTLATDNKVGGLIGKLKVAESKTGAQEFFLGNLYKLTDANLAARTLAGVAPDATRLAAFVNEAVAGTVGSDPAADPSFVRAMLQSKELEPLRSTALGFAYWQAPTPLQDLERFAKDSTYRNEQWRIDHNNLDSFNSRINNAAARSVFVEAYALTHDVGLVQRAFADAVNAHYQRAMPTLRKWQESLASGGTVADAQLYQILIDRAQGGGITKAELERLVQQHSGAVGGLPRGDKLAIAKAVVVAGPGKLFGDDWRALDYVLSLSGAQYGKVDGTGNFVVWAGENRTASNDKIFHVAIDKPVSVSADGLKSEHVHVSGTEVLTTAEGLMPFPNGGNVPSDGFSQVQTLYAARSVLRRVQDVGVDLEQLLQNPNNPGEIRVKVNGMTDTNAYYSPNDNEIVLGTAGGKWPLASDPNVSTHEMGHLLLDHIAPDLVGGAYSLGASIHEGFGDALAAFDTNDPEISEDWHIVGNEPYLRNVNNQQTVGTTSSECHDRGQVYGGFWWSMKTKLASLGVDDNEACQHMIAIMVGHAMLYKSGSPTSKDFVENVFKAAREHLKGVLTEEQLKELMEATRTDAVRRGLVTPSWTEPVVPPVTAQRLSFGPTEGTAGVATAALTARAMSALRKPGSPEGKAGLAALTSAVQEHVKSKMRQGGKNKMELRAISQQLINGTLKVTYQAMVRNPKDNSLVAVHGATVSTLVKDGMVTEVGGEALNIADTIDFTPSVASGEAVQTAIAGPLRELFASNKVENRHLSSYVLANYDTIFASSAISTSPVVYQGKVAVRLNTKVGDFIIDAAGTITPGKLLMMA